VEKLIEPREWAEARAKTMCRLLEPLKEAMPDAVDGYLRGNTGAYIAETLRHPPEGVDMDALVRAAYDKQRAMVARNG
jgi:hypothetical protein